ncbi:outer dense fiber protein 2 isoform X1, partial [Clarias magur]
MKNAMRTTSSSPPLHVHVNESTPVHVHVKKTMKNSPNKPAQVKAKSCLRPTAKVKTRVPWIPPGKASTRETSYKWEGPSHCLEINPLPEPDPSRSALRLEDLSTDEEEARHGRINQYEKKIDSLMTEVSTLKNEVELCKKEQQLERQSERLSASQRVIAEQEEELAEVAKELEITERENTLLRESMEKILEENNYGRLERENLQQEKDVLLRKLVEAEFDSTAAAKQVLALRDTVSHMSRTEKRMMGSDSSLLARQKDLLLQKLETFERTNRTLRRLLREQHEREMDSLQVLEQKDSLLKKLTEVEAENSHLQMKLQDKAKEVTDLVCLLENEKEHVKTTSDLSKSLESNRAHLQGQLRNKEAENNRLSVQIKNLERTAGQQQGELEHVQAQMRELKQRAEGDKDALKKATRALKQRAERSEDTAGQLSAQLTEMEVRLADAISTAETWSSRHAKGLKEKGQLEVEITLLNSRITDLTEQLHVLEEKTRAERDGLLDRLHSMTTESTTVRLENQSLKATLSALEEKLSLSRSEVEQVKASVKQYESLVDSYKIQLQKTRAEADEYSLHAQQAEREARTLREELDQELDQARKQLMGRLNELEPLPDTLRRTEFQLQEAQENERVQERRNNELTTSLAELRVKVEQQSVQMEKAQQRNTVLMEENNQLKHKLESLDRKMEEASSQNGDLLQMIAKREETILHNQVRLEEKSRECNTLNRQLEEALEDARRQVSNTRERAASKERASQSKVIELETQLSRTTSELNQLRRAKDEVYLCSVTPDLSGFPQTSHALILHRGYTLTVMTRRADTQEFIAGRVKNFEHYNQNKGIRRSMERPDYFSRDSGNLLSEEQLLCSICLDVFTDPVTTPCGHNFCKSCLAQCWEKTYNCPMCKEKFTKRPELKVNTTLREVADHFKKKNGHDKPAVLCDACSEVKQKAMKSCLDCCATLCKTHLEPHNTIPTFKKHKLISPVENLKDYICQKHKRPLEVFCKDDQTCVCQFCTETDHKNHNTVPVEDESGERKIQLGKTQTDVQRMIQDRLKKIQEIRHSVDLGKRSTEKEKADSVEVFTALIRSIERSQAELLKVMEEKQKTAEMHAEGLIKELEEEITVLKTRDSELEQLSHTEEHLHLLQIYSSVCRPPHTKNWTEISINTDSSGDAVRTALSQLQQTLNKKLTETLDDKLKKAISTELQRIQQYA